MQSRIMNRDDFTEFTTLRQTGNRMIFKVSEKKMFRLMKIYKDLSLDMIRLIQKILLAR